MKQAITILHCQNSKSKDKPRQKTQRRKNGTLTQEWKLEALVPNLTPFVNSSSQIRLEAIDKSSIGQLSSIWSIAQVSNETYTENVSLLRRP